MALEHEYHVVIDDKGTSKKYSLNLPEEHHHNNFENAERFFQFLGVVMGVAWTSIQTYEYIKSKR